MPAEATLLDSFELEGRWGLPGSPLDAWLDGKARFDPQGGISLETRGALGALAGRIPAEEVREFPVVHGITRAGKDVSLFRVIGGRFAFLGLGSYHALKLIAGGHLPPLSEARFGSVAVRFHNLVQFIGFSGIDERIGEDPLFSISYRKPSKLALALDEIALDCLYSAGIEGDIFEKRQIWQQGWFYATLQAHSDLETLLSGPIASLHYLLEFSLGHRVPIVQIQLEPSPVDGEVNRETRSAPELNVFFSQLRPNPLPALKHPANLLFTLAALGDNRSAYVQKWHEGFKRFRSALDLFFSLTALDPETTVEHQFLANVNAFEALHRVIGATQHERSEADHKERVTQIIDRTPEDYKKWLKGKLKHSNEVSLEQRLREICRQQPQNLRTTIDDEFAAAVARTRNFLIHRNERPAEQVLVGENLWIATHSLRLLVQIELLRQMGVEEASLHEITQRSPHYQILMLNRT